MRWMLAMLVFVPVSIAVAVTHGSPALIFGTSCLAIVPLAGFMGTATEEIAKRRGPTLGGLLNATFGNATELIIALIAVQHGQIAIVKASLVGSIIGNILLVLGLSVFLGGLKYKIQSFSQDAALLHATMLGMAAISLLVPALFVRNAPIVNASAGDPRVESLSLGVAAVLMILYFGGLIFSLYTHESLFGVEETDTEPFRWSATIALLVLGASTLFVAVESELLVGSIEPVVAQWHVTPLFLGIIVIPIVGNAAEHSTAVLMALRNKIEISLNIAVSSSTQIAMFVAPLMIFVSPALGHPVDILFSNFELVAITAAVAIAVLISMDGKSHWLEGAQLLATYVIVALAFYFIPR